MADVAALSVISSGVVGVLGAAGGFYSQRVTLRNEESKRLEARRSDLRDVLAEAASIAMGYNADYGRYDAVAQNMALVMDKVIAAMGAQRGKLGIRVGPDSPVYAAYDKLELELYALEDALLAAPPELTLASIKNAMGEEQVDPAVRLILDGYGGTEKALSAFLAAAAALVGPPSAV